MSEQFVFAQKCVLKCFHFSTPLTFSAGKQGEIGESSSFISPSFQQQKEHLIYIDHHNHLQEVGLKQLLTTYKDETCLRQFLASIVLLGYHLFLTNHMGQVPALQCQQQHQLKQLCLSGRLPSGLHSCLPDSDSEAQTAPKGCFLPFLPRPLPACPRQLRRSSSMLCSRKCCSVGVAAVPPRGCLGACLGRLLQVWLELFFARLFVNIFIVLLQGTLERGAQAGLSSAGGVSMVPLHILLPQGGVLLHAPVRAHSRGGCRPGGIVRIGSKAETTNSWKVSSDGEVRLQEGGEVAQPGWKVDL